MRAYSKLKEIFKEASLSSDIAGILHWDMSTMMPSNSRNQRADQLAYLSKLSHDKISSNEVRDLILKAKSEELNQYDTHNLREIEREYKLTSSVPSNLIQKISRISAKCEGEWQEARKNSNFNLIKNSLGELIKLTKEEADILGKEFNLSPYDALVNKFEPGLNTQLIANVFDDLQQFLTPLIDTIIEKQKSQNIFPIQFKINENQQKDIAEHIMKIIGFDFKRGRLDKSVHPFCGGSTNDVRITTRYNENNPFSSLDGVMHETGHALYELNLPEKWSHQPVGKARGMAMHESQSLLIEMQITRSLAFKKFLSKLLKNKYNIIDRSSDANNLYLLGTRVEKSFIRVESDEVTYPLHIILRFNLERKIFNNEIGVNDLPEVWNDEYKKLFNKKVEKDTDGCLQDVHWYAGLFGYFPTYSLGALTAAQFASQLRIDLPTLDFNIEKGQFDDLVNWLKTNIHEKASFFSTNEVLEQVTKSSLNAKYFKNYINNRYL
ncbi:carboxypeptidase M32 [Pelagibacteraceae bacterium]|nr:carboxypeptidase M32 [Pelagibacteraceae bacterium]